MSRHIVGRSCVFSLLAAFAFTLLGSGCERSAGPHGGGFPPPLVSVQTIEPKDLPVTYEYPAQTLGYREVEVRARVTGILKSRNYREGALVKRGQSLFTIDPEPFKVALARAEADLAVAEARHVQARRETTRLRPVIEARAVSQKEYDDAVSAEHVAEAEAKSARARLNEAKLNLEYTRVEAPIAGAASRSVVSEGTLVSGPSVLLTTVTQTDPMYVIFGIPDREYLKLRREAEAGRVRLPPQRRFTARLKLMDGELYAQAGTLDFTDVRVNSQTGTVEARAEVPNSGGALRAGEFVRVMLEGAVRPGAIAVPQKAVLEGPKGKFVYVLGAENRAEARPVEVGDWRGEDWIINGGLKAGDRVITDGVMRLGPGAPVKIAEGGAGAQSAKGTSSPAPGAAPSSKR